MNAARGKTGPSHLVAGQHDFSADGWSYHRHSRWSPSRADLHHRKYGGHRLGEFVPTRYFRGHVAKENRVARGTVSKDG